MKKNIVLLLILTLLLTGCYDFGISKKSSSSNSNTDTKKEIKKDNKKKDNKKKENKKTTDNPDYSVSDIVSVKGEKFYILNEYDNEVELLAVYNLNKEGTKQQVDATVNDTKVDFSSTIYWQNEAINYYDSWTDGDDYKNGKTYFDLNDLSSNKAGDAITKVRSYATSLGGSNGRLLTYEEVSKLRPDYPDMIGGHDNHNGSTNYLNYYLSSVRYHGTDRVFTVRGQGADGGEICSYADSNYGVRPVITISKKLLD